MDSDDALLQECASLRVALSRFQDEAYQASVKLQRYTFDTSELQDRNAVLEQENASLREELDILRTTPIHDPTSTADARIGEWTLSMRKLSNKLTETENQLQLRIEMDLERASDRVRAKTAADRAHELAALCRVEVEQARTREEDLEAKCRTIEEKCLIYDGTIQEYASLVRKLEGKSTQPSPGFPSSQPLDHLQVASEALQRLTDDFSETAQALRQEITDLNVALAAAESRAWTEAEVSAAGRLDLSAVSLELERVKADDVSAAGMVERYMKFTQSQSMALHGTLESLQIRHNTTVNTLQEQLAGLTRKLHVRRQAEYHIRSTLDELGNELMKEKFGRRREVLLKMSLLETVDRYKRSGQLPPLDATSGELLAAENAVKTLAEELRLETARRMELELQHPLPAPDETADIGKKNVHADSPATSPTDEPPHVNSEALAPEEALSHIVGFSDSTATLADKEPTQPQVDLDVPSPPSTSIVSTSTKDLPDIPADPELPLTLPVAEPDGSALTTLRTAASRYDPLSRSLRDCYATLSELRDVVSSKTTFEDDLLPKEVVQAALDRLCDYTEDVRVELEIRSGDEALLAKGFETLLALRKSGRMLAEEEFQDVDDQIQAFVSGSEPSVHKAFAALSRKTEDVEHDVAVMKRAVHDPMLAIEHPTPSTPPAGSSSHHPPEEEADTDRWPGWLRPSPSPSLGAGAVAFPAAANRKPSSQTFGNIMATRSLLRHSSSTQSLPRQNESNPFAGLGLKVPMPTHVTGPVVLQSANPSPRQRTMSGMLMLGLGGGSGQRMRTASVGLRAPPLLAEWMDKIDAASEDIE